MTTKKVPLADLDWDGLRLFLQIQRTGSLSQAARNLRIDHSTVSRRLAQLELCLGGALFERRPTGLKPTELAHLMTPQAEAMEAAMLALQEQLGAGADRTPTGNVRIAMMEGIGTTFVARHLAPLLERHAGLHIELVTSATVVNVSRREADIFVSFFRPEGQGLACEAMGHFALYLYAAPAYLAAHGTPTRLDELVSHQFVSYVDDLIQLDAVRWLDELVQKPQMRMQSNSMLAQMSAAASGLGLVLLPKFSVVQESGLVPVLTDAARVSRTLWLSVHHDLQYSSRIRAVTSYLQQLFTTQQEWLNSPPAPTPRA
ncbi:LysR family transcriptional regulator [Xenophilus arseniciresistens]|uniref:LysR family transcriptional regulator n=1 Tax=Xenophilus arseniciresistens TaxID=1283306 RepID=A0AAE3NBF5_9BURK|nr:LysR family transcriptional regulator [Xenophilus arseniciresistens]MDA7418576.1 LysR family transcriptional regulator [Xenophilus arseniciresistens]